jgi:hypothetical protein
MYCTTVCAPTHVYLGVVFPLLITLLVIVVMKYKNAANDKARFFKLFIGYALAVLIAYYLLNWLCESEFTNVAWVIAVLPIIAYAYTGYMFVTSTDCMNSINGIMSQCLRR